MKNPCLGCDFEQNSPNSSACIWCVNYKYACGNITIEEESIDRNELQSKQDDVGES